MERADYRHLLETSRRVNWRVEDLLDGNTVFDFERPFLPEALARTEPLDFLTAREKRTLNHIRAHGYLAMFELVECFIEPFIRTHSMQSPHDEPFRHAALQNFADEELKHMQLFRSFRNTFHGGFGVECGFIGPAEQIRAAVLSHRPLAVAIAILGIEWMSQSHYVDSVRDDTGLEPRFKSLLKHHWIEEVQHARLDSLVLRSMAREAGEGELDRAMQEYFEIGKFIAAGLEQQVMLDLESLQRATGRSLGSDDRARFVQVQSAALHWTFLGSAMCNREFQAAIGRIDPAASARLEQAASEAH
jgi:hypothetical protein